MSDRFSLTFLGSICTVGIWFIADSLANFKASSLSVFFLTFFQRQASCEVFAVSVSFLNALPTSTIDSFVVSSLFFEQVH